MKEEKIMAQSLVIVESPAKAKTINKYLGRQFNVKSSVGHVRDLPVSGSGKKASSASAAEEKAKMKAMTAEQKAKYKQEKARKALVKRMGVDPENDWDASYEILPNKEKVINELKKAAENADTVYLATDLDREGEAIAWHLQEVIGGDPSRFKRVVFNEITKTAIQQAFESPGELNMNRVEAQQTRRFLDRVVGYMVSPLLWSKVARGLSAGRVQSVAVKLVVEREREIRAFVPEEYWEVFANTLHKGSTEFRLDVAKFQGKAFKPTNKAETDVALAALEKSVYTIASREDKPTSSKANAPFITSTLQQAASTRLGYSVKKTMTMAQRLYEAGYITYMRTDSTNLSQDAVEAARQYIASQYGDEYVPEKPNVYTSKDQAQEAHEAIRPSDVTKTGDQLTDMERDAQRLYTLIWQRFVACQMPPAKFMSSTILVDAGDYQLKAKGRILKFDGYLKAMPTSKDDDVHLPDVSVGDTLDLQKLDPVQHFTKPTARFTEASLVKELEKRGIGRPSTYASIISTIQDRGYVKQDSKRFYAEKMGVIVTDRLSESFTDLMNFDFTARMEQQLDQISDGSVKWKKILNDFYGDFKSKLTTAESDVDEGGMRENNPVEISMACDKCGRPMQIRTASTGVFLGCSGYALPPKERCTNTKNLVDGDEFVGADEDLEVEQLRSKKRCQKCGTAMDSYLVDESNKLHICGNSPDCSGYEIEKGQFALKGYDGPTIECDKCGSEMQLKSGRFGKYFGCMADDCKNTRKLLRSGQPAPPKEDPVPMPHLKCAKHDDYYLLRDGASGIFLAASQFPKHRETRAPYIKELQTVAKELPEKFKYLLDAPVEDPAGNDSLVRFSRKTKEQYVTTEVDGKATSWRAHYQDGKWVEEDTKADKKKAAAKKGPAKKAAAKKTDKK